MPRPKPHHLAKYPSTKRLIARRDPKPHIIFRDGEWCIYRNWWKSNWPTAARISAPTIKKLREKILKAHNGYRFGAHDVRKRQEKQTHAPHPDGQVSDQG